MDDLPDGIVGRFHDPRIVRKILSDEIGALLFDAVSRLREVNMSKEKVVEFQHRLELDILRYARVKYNWSVQDLPVHITLDFVNGEIFLELSGPLAVDVYVSIQEFTETGQVMPLPDFLEDDAYESDDTEEESEWSYRR